VTSFVNGNSFLGRVLADCGFGKAYDGGWQLWNPAQLPYQNVDIALAGASAYVDEFRIALPGISFYAQSRLD